jgi:RNA polymerase sigma factor (sigma-70 family)
MKYSSSTLVRTDNVQRYFKDINNPKYSPLDDVVIRRLFADRNRNRERIVNANIRLVATIAKSYDKADNFMDFNQEGIEGLIEAVDKYDPNADAKFSSYAANWIRARMSMLCRELNMVQRSNQGKIGSKANKFKEQFFNENMRDATTEEIIEHLSENCGIDVLYANEVYGISINSINEELNDDELTPETCGEFAVKTSCQNAYVDQIEQEDLADAINKMMKILTDKERDFIVRHIYNGETYETIAETSDISYERVRQIVMGGLKKMKECEFAKKKFACYQ